MLLLLPRAPRPPAEVPSARRRRRVALPAAAAIALAVLASGCVINGTWTAAALAPTAADGVVNDVSCIADDWCMAVGSTSGDHPMVQTWDGTAWSDAPAPPGDDDLDNGGVATVDCGTADACVAQVDKAISEPGDFEYLYLWDGATWTEVPPGGTIDGSDAFPRSCSSDGTCTVLNTRDGLTVVWDGDQFSSIAYDRYGPANGYWTTMDCVSGTDCIATSDFRTSRWDGSTWTTLASSSTSIAGLGVESPGQMTCPTSTSCIAIASGWTSLNETFVHWDGSTWTIENAPAGVNTIVVDVSCSSPGECVALGDHIPWYIPASTNAALAWNGADWYVAPAPPGGPGATYTGVSCVPLRCTAVGGTNPSPSQPLAATYAWTNP